LRQPVGDRWDGRRSLLGRKVLQLRRLGAAVLWNQLWRGPHLPRRTLRVLWRSRRALLRRHEWHRSLRGRDGLQQCYLDHGSVRSVWWSWRDLLRWQHVRERVLLQRNLHCRQQYLHGERLHKQLWHLQVRPLYLRQRGRAVLPDGDLPDRVRLLELRAGLRVVKLQQRVVDLPGLRQEGWSLLRDQQQRLRDVHGRGNAVPVQQLDRPLRVQDLRRPRRGLLQYLDWKYHDLQGHGRGLRQQHKHV
jgi:hypothetical protein